MNGIPLPVEKGRLIALVPECLVNNVELMNKIYQMATREEREVFYLALVDDDTKVLAITRSLATLKAMVSGGKLSSASRVVETSQWIAALREIYRPGDAVVCQAEQQVRGGFLRTVPTSEFVCTLLDAPVRTISGFYRPEQIQFGRWWTSITYWIGQLSIIAGFFTLEVRLDQGLHGIARTIILFVLLLVALGAGVAWDKIIG